MGCYARARGIRHRDQLTPVPRKAITLLSLHYVHTPLSLLKYGRAPSTARQGVTKKARSTETEPSTHVFSLILEYSSKTAQISSAPSRGILDGVSTLLALGRVGARTGYPYFALVRFAGVIMMTVGAG
jgi:hypothetical protein